MWTNLPQSGISAADCRTHPERQRGDTSQEPEFPKNVRDELPPAPGRLRLRSGLSSRRVSWSDSDLPLGLASHCFSRTVSAQQTKAGHVVLHRSLEETGCREGRLFYVRLRRPVVFNKVTF